MRLKRYFDISRFWSLMKLEWFRSRRRLLMIIGTIFGISLAGMLLEPLVENINVFDSHLEGYGFTLIAGGFVLSSLSFHDLTDTLKRYQYLTLPVSAFEKVLSMWLISSIGWMVLFTVSYTVFFWIANPIGTVLYPNVDFISFDPFSDLSNEVRSYYFVLQGLFLVGAVYFKGYVFPKTVFTLVLIIVVVGLILFLYKRNEFLSPHYCQDGECEIIDAMATHILWKTAKGLFWWVLAPLCWVVTYLALKRKEA